MSNHNSSRPQSRHAYEAQTNGRSGSRASGTSYSRSRAAGVSSYARKRQGRTRKKVLRGVLVGILCVFIGAGIAVAAYLGDINSRLTGDLDDSTRDLLSDTIQYDDPFYMLLLGVDKSEERVNSDEYGADESNYRADSIILARIDPKAQTVTLVSLHRDTMTDMGENGTQKLNAAYSIGGPSYMIKCVEELAGVDISHYAEVDFEEFTSIVDTIGGIDVTLPIDVIDSYSGANLTAGEHTLNGTEALALARSRHAYDNYGDGDVYRAANQRMVIGAIVKKVLTLDLATMTSAVSEMASSVTTDLDVSSILGLAVQFKDLDTENNIYSGMEPTEGLYLNDTWYEQVQTTAWKTLMDRVKQGLPPYASDGDSTYDSSIVGSYDSADGTSDGSSTSNSTTTGTVDTASSVAPDYSGYAAVVNSAGINGLAGEKSAELDNVGFVSDAVTGDTSATVSHIYYNGSAAEGKAVAAATTLGISTSNISENDGTWSTDYDIIVVLGSDQG